MNPPEFLIVADGHYRLTALELGLMFDIDRLHRDRHDLVGELTVYCDLPGAKTVEGVLSWGSFNLSSPTVRTQRARQLRDQSESELDFLSLLEHLCHRTIAAERTGAPARPLHTFDRPGPDAEFEIDGLRLLRDHHTIWFGDGGSLKSYLALYGAGRLAARGLRVLFADWELAGGDHRDRLERLFGPTMPTVDYLRCDRPLVEEVDRIRRCVDRQATDFLIIDSIAPAAGGPPEAAEHATAFWRAVRQIGVGGLHLAHINKSENGDQKPFGSAFWHNLARSTWFVKQAGVSGDGSRVTVGLFNRKANLTRLYPAVGFQFAFSETQTNVTRVNLADVEDLAGRLPLWQRIAHLLKAGPPRTIAELAHELEAKEDTVKKAVSPKRVKSMFTQVPGSDGVMRIALVERRTA